MLEVLNYILFFCLGTVIASFLNLCVYRVEKEFSLKEIFIGRSECESCSKPLSWYELVPIVSYFLLLGKCMKCEEKFSVFHPISEIFLGICFVFFYHYSIDVFYYIFFLILYFWAVSDFHYQTIPKLLTDTVFVLSGIVWVFFLFYDFDMYRVYSVVLSLLIALVVFLVSFRKKVFGFGDVIVFVILSFWFDIYSLVSILLYSIVLGGIFGFILVLFDRKYLKKYVPFLPFVFFGFLMFLFLEIHGIFLFDYILPIW